MTAPGASRVAAAATVLILFGALPATGWAVHLMQAGGFNPLWILICCAAAAGFWVVALAPDKLHEFAICRWSVVFALSAGVFLATVPMVLNARAWLIHFERLSLDQHLTISGVLVLLISSVLTVAYCFRLMRQRPANA